MNRLKFSHGLRETVCRLVIACIISAAQVVAQQTALEIQAADSQKQIANSVAAETQPTKITTKDFAARLLTNKFHDSLEFEKARLRELTLTNKLDKKPQTQEDDDTMEGVMGRRPAGKARIGGHVGFVLPLVARRSSSTALPIVDNFTIGFPVGLTVRTKSSVAFDFEFIPTINTPGRNNFFVTIHPGIIYGFKKKYAVGVRAAYDAGNDSYGFTPLISRGFKINNKLGFFIEGDFPIRWNRGLNGNRFASGAFAAHFGVAF